MLELKCDAVSITSWLIQIETPVNKSPEPVTLYLPNHIHNHHGDGFVSITEHSTSAPAYCQENVWNYF